MTPNERAQFECANLNRYLSTKDEVIFVNGRPFLVMTRATVTKQRRKYCEPLNLDRVV